MSELSTLLLLACTTCLNTQQVAQLPTAACDTPQQQQSADCSSAVSETAASTALNDLSQSNTPIGPYSRGERVVALQIQLKQFGYYTGALDGIYGRLTRGAVTQFQQENGLRPDGIVGTETQETLIKLGQSALSASSDPTTASPTVGSESSKPAIEPAAADSSTADPSTEPSTESSSGPSTEPLIGPSVKPLVGPSPEASADASANPSETSSFDPAPFVEPEAETTRPAASPTPVSPPLASPPVMAPEGGQTLWSSSTAVIQSALGSPSTSTKQAFALIAGIALVAGWGVVIRREAKRNALIEEDLGLSSDIELLLADLPTSPEPTPDETASKPVKSTARRAKTLVATLVSNDCTPESAYTYSLVDDADGSFVLINRELWLTHRRPDQANLNRYTVVIRCTDRRGVAIDQPFRIRVMPSLSTPRRQTADGANVSPESRVEALSSIG